MPSLTIWPTRIQLSDHRTHADLVMRGPLERAAYFSAIRPPRGVGLFWMCAFRFPPLSPPPSSIKFRVPEFRWGL